MIDDLTALFRFIICIAYESNGLDEFICDGIVYSKVYKTDRRRAEQLPRMSSRACGPWFLPIGARLLQRFAPCAPRLLLRYLFDDTILRSSNPSCSTFLFYFDAISFRLVLCKTRSSA
jgi:hypothetical protein